MRLTSRNLRQFYNVQDTGLGRALAELGHHVKVYNFVHSGARETSHESDSFEVHYLPARSLGGHTLHSFHFIENGTDAVIAYCDNQIGYQSLVSYCKKRDILLLPYVGVTGSHHRNAFVRCFLNWIIPNTRIFRRQTVLAKTPAVAGQLRQSGATDVVVAPACLDMNFVKKEYGATERRALAGELGLDPSKKYILFIGRMIEEKRPVEMVEIFAAVAQRMEDVHLIMIGQGILEQDTARQIAEKNLSDRCTVIRQVNNDVIWKYYVLADVFVNLNREEIFGMAMLEAMYYKCAVVAASAPGPEYIFTDQVNGFLCDSKEQIIDRVIQVLEEYPQAVVEAAYEHIRKDFMWSATAKVVEETICRRKGIEWKK
jgi:1,2-diacylglycerol 3-alpha-glucosyltransferase